MKLLNVGCGGHRPGSPWINIDTLKAQLTPGSPEMENLLKEENYIECSLTVERIPLEQNSLDGILCQHVLEHMDCHSAACVVKECHYLLKPGGWLAVSVPDAAFFLANHYRDTRENAVHVFGEPISEPWHTSFFDYALFHREHIQILTLDSLWCILMAGGFNNEDVFDYETVSFDSTPVAAKLVDQLNRLPFSAILFAHKPD